MGICDDKNGPKVFIRGLHTFLVFIVVLPFLFPSSALLKRVRLGEPFSVLPVVFYISLAVSSLILYHLTCLVDPGFVPLDVSNFSDTEDEDEDEDEVYDEEKYRKSLLQRDSSLSVENKTAENDDESDYDDDMYAQHHSKKYTENESMLNNNKSSNNNTTNKNNNDGKTKLKSRFCAFCNIKQPLRAKHCEQCKRCVRKFDHHCPWLVTCVGEQNHRFFFLFLLTTLSAVVWSCYLAWQTFEMKDTPLNTVVHNCMVLVAGVVLLLGGASVMALFFIHIYLALNNLTTWEFLARHRISYLKVVEMDKNPFHLGYLKNFSVFLCSFNSQNWEAIYQKFLAKKNKIFL